VILNTNINKRTFNKYGISMSGNIAFSKIVEHLTEVVRLSHDKRLTSYLAEYLVAFEIDKLGYDATVFGIKRGADLFVCEKGQNIGEFVEVKSSHIDLNGFDCAASFGKGTSIVKRQFNSCVFVVFENLQPIEYLVFTIDELEEVIKKKRGAYPNNPYLLFRFKTMKDYEAAFPNPEERLKIEINLHQHPERFRNQWNKILS